MQERVRAPASAPISQPHARTGWNAAHDTGAPPARPPRTNIHKHTNARAHTHAHICTYIGGSTNAERIICGSLWFLCDSSAVAGPTPASDFRLIGITETGFYRTHAHTPTCMYIVVYMCVCVGVCRVVSSIGAARCRLVPGRSQSKHTHLAHK